MITPENELKQTETRCEPLHGGFQAPYDQEVLRKQLCLFAGEYGVENITVWVPHTNLIDLNKYSFAKFWDCSSIAIQVRYQDPFTGGWINFAYLMDGIK